MIGSIVSSSLRLRTLVVVVAAIVMGVGIAKLNQMPVDVFPEIMPVTVTVHTEALGLSAAEVEQLITVPIEADLLAGTPWVDVMRSESVPGLSSIEMTFKHGTKPMDARQVVQERLTQAHALPNVSKPPQILQPLSSTNRLMLIGLSSKSQSLIEMSVLARWTIRPRLMGVPGVANVSIWGQRERQLQVQVDPARLAERNIPLIDIVKTAGNALWYSPLTFLEASVAGTGGFIETPNQRLGVRHVLPISVAADLAKVPVEGTTIRLEQVATVVEDHQPLIGDAMNGDGLGLLLMIEKMPGVNTLEVSNDVLAALDALKPGLGGIEFDPNVYHPARYIEASKKNVGSALLVSLILVAVMMLLLSYDWRAAAIGLVAIPMALAAAVLVLGMSGGTMNVMVLAGLIAALGIIVDDAIVYSADLARRLRRGTSFARAIFDASAEVRGPMVFATAIVLLAVVPTLFVAGVPGALLEPMVASYAIAVVASLAVAITLTPALTLLFFRNAEIAGRESRLANMMGGLIHPRAAVGLAVVAAIAGLALLPGLRLTPSPLFKERDMLVTWGAVPGTSRAEMNRILDRVGRELRSVPGVRNVGAHVGRAILSDQVVGVSSSEMWVSLDPNAAYEKTVSAIEDIVGGYPGVEAEVTTFLQSRFNQPLSGHDEPIVVRLYGQEQGKLDGEAEKLKQALAGIAGITEPDIEAAVQEPVVEIMVDLDKAKEFGVKPGDARRAAATLLSGLEVGNLFEEQKVFEVVVWGTPQIRNSVEGISNLLIDTPGGRRVRLGDVASLRMSSAPNVIRRENVARSLDIVAAVEGRSVSAVTADVRKLLKDSNFPLEYRAELLDDFAKKQQAWTRLIAASIGIAIGILFILQAAFASWGLAFAVLLTLPVALAGGVIAAAMSGTALSFASAAGFLTLLGLAARQGILLVGRYRDLRMREGMGFGPELVRQGARDQSASVVMAAIVTAAAVLPFAIFGSRAGHEALGPLALVILGGLVTTTIYTLGVVPALYSRFGGNATADSVSDADLAVSE